MKIISLKMMILMIHTTINFLKGVLKRSSFFVEVGRTILLVIESYILYTIATTINPKWKE